MFWYLKTWSTFVNLSGWPRRSVWLSHVRLELRLSSMGIVGGLLFLQVFRRLFHWFNELFLNSNRHSSYSPKFDSLCSLAKVQKLVHLRKADSNIASGCIFFSGVYSIRLYMFQYSSINVLQPKPKRFYIIYSIYYFLKRQSVFQWTIFFTD